MLHLPQGSLMRLATLIAVSFLLPATAPASSKGDSTRAAVTYVAGGGAVYISIGRDAGVADSSLCYVLERGDTVAVLKVLATSSRSSVCTVIRSTRPLAVGDGVHFTASFTAAPPAQPASGATGSDSSAAPPPAPAGVKPVIAPPAIAVRGRINAQYFTTHQSGSGSDLVRPGLVVNLRGSARDLPLSFELYGNFRSLSYAGGTPFGRGSVNQSRIYVLALRYDDGTNRIAAGRVTQALIGTAGYIDGVILSRRIGDLSLGASGGFEPLFSQRSFGSEFRKFSLFASYALQGSVPASATVAYTRSYYHSLLDRDVASGSLTVTPDRDWLFSAAGDFDLHVKRGEALIPHPSLTNLYGSLQYRVSQILSVGAGISSWRPTYAFSSVASVPDSMLDRTLRTSPSANIALALPAGISLYNTFSARSSDGGFGKEYSNFTSVSVANMFNQSLSARGSLSFNATAYAQMRGLGGSIQKSIGRVVDATVRYQWYRYAYARWGGVSTSRNAGIDLLVTAIPGVTVWGSVERMMSGDVNTTSLSLDIGWRF